MIQQRLIQLSTPVERTLLSDSAWIDIGQRWWDADGELLDRLVRRCAWRAERRRMYDRVVEVPRLVAFYGADDPLPDPVLYEMRAQLNDRYAADLGEPLVSAGLCWYRDGRDSVAWHGDTLGRGRHEDTVVAIVSIGAERTFALRPARDGRLVPTHVGPRGTEVVACRGTARQRAVPSCGRPLAVTTVRVDHSRAPRRRPVTREPDDATSASQNRRSTLKSRNA